MNLSSDNEKKNKAVAGEALYGGLCSARIDGKAVLISGALPGETVLAEITARHKDYDEARAAEILEASPRRVIPPCPLCGICGGCDFMHAGHDYQIELKERIARSLFERQGIPLPKIKTISGLPLGYRSRFQLRDGGMEGRRTNDVVPIPQCPVAVAEINEWLAETPMESRPKGRGFLFGSEKASPRLSFALEAKKAGRSAPQKGAEKSGKKRRAPKAPPARFEGVSEADLCPVQIELLGKKIAFDARGFFQSNIGLLEKTIPLLTEGLEGKSALDLYSGAGTFAAFLAERFENVVMVEQNRLSLVYAERNLAGAPHESFGINGADFARRNAEAAARRLGGFDAAVIDPPRSGIEKEALDWLCKSGIPVIKYLSCNPATQARDAKKLREAGYEIAELHLLDYYPQTSHLETLATCIKK